MLVFVVEVVSSGEELILLTVLSLIPLVKGLHLPVINIDQVTKLGHRTKLIDQRLNRLRLTIRIHLNQCQ